MTDKKPELIIRSFISENPEDMAAFTRDLDYFLGEWTDPPDQMEEALNAANRDGILIEAVIEENSSVDSEITSSKRLGIAVGVRTPFLKFQPVWHLAYIATSPEARGLGAGKALLNEMIKLTEGDIALHVAASNDNAVGFYEKQGWKAKYVRMMPVKKDADQS